MSYCRWLNGSSIYLYGDIHYNGICCFACELDDAPHNESGHVILKTYSDAINHMEEHRHNGDRAPYKRVIEQLKEEQLEEGDTIDYSNIIEDSRTESVRRNYIWKPLKSQFRWI